MAVIKPFMGAELAAKVRYFEKYNFIGQYVKKKIWQASVIQFLLTS